MIQPDTLIKMLHTNKTLFTRQLTGISHSQSLIQPDNLPNSINWLAGHLISAKTIPLQHVGQSPIWSDETRARYRGGSQPITADGEGIVAFDELVRLFQQSQSRLIRGLKNTSFEHLSQPSGYQDNTIADSLAYFYFHECYHLGQIADVATALGKESVWVN